MTLGELMDVDDFSPRDFSFHIPAKIQTSKYDTLLSLIVRNAICGNGVYLAPTLSTTFNFDDFVTDEATFDKDKFEQFWQTVEPKYASDLDKVLELNAKKDKINHPWIVPRIVLMPIIINDDHGFAVLVTGMYDGDERFIRCVRLEHTMGVGALDAHGKLWTTIMTKMASVVIEKYIAPIYVPSAEWSFAMKAMRCKGTIMEKYYDAELKKVCILHLYMLVRCMHCMCIIREQVWEPKPTALPSTIPRSTSRSRTPPDCGCWRRRL